MTKSSVAIIGTGPAGLASGHFLHNLFDVTVYEKNDYAGGHANSVTVEHNGELVGCADAGGASIAIDGLRKLSPSYGL